MERQLKLIQGNYCCLYDGRIISLTEKNFVFIEIDLKTSRVSIMNKKNLKNRIEYITSIEHAIYLVDMAGNWIAETTLKSQEIKYYQINCHKKNTSNFSYICKYGASLFLFLRDEPTVTIFDTVTKTFEHKKLCIDAAEIYLDSGCTRGKNAYLFSSSARKYYIYDMDERKTIQKEDLCIEGLATYATCYQNNIFVLSRNTVYCLNDNFKVIVQINDPVYCSKICIAGDIIWFLPGLGEKIYTYRFGDTDICEYHNYPENYEYDIENGWGKFVGKAEDTEHIYWSMRSNNYILNIRKKDGKELWIRPQIDNEAILIKKSFFSIKDKNLREGNFTLSDLIDYLNL